jgi:hypothetical protein
VEALAKAIAGETAGEMQLCAARTLAEAQLELKRIRATRAATPTDLDQMFDPRTLARLCALNRYERLAASRRMAARRWLDEIAGSLALQLLFLSGSESMGNHDSIIVDAGSVD